MILRVFRGRVRPGMADAYRRFVIERALPHFRTQPGFLDARIGAPANGSEDFLVVTAWRDLASVRAFAGPDWERARTSADERRMLTSSTVEHYVDVTPDDVPGALGVSAVTSDGNGEPYRALDAGDVRLDLAGRVVHVNGSSLELPPREFSILVELALHAGQPIPSDELARRAWPDAAAATGEDVRRAVYRLRRKLSAEGHFPVIRNRRGYGYVLEPAPRRH